MIAADNLSTHAMTRGMLDAFLIAKLQSHSALRERGLVEYVILASVVFNEPNATGATI